jgi:hypothetical protein
MEEKEVVAAQIASAFAAVQYPGDWCLRGSDEGEEPYLVEEEFKGKSNWQALPPSFLDQAPGGYASALSFFSDEAFRFYLPGYLIADVRGQLQRTNPVFHLTHGLSEPSRRSPVNPQKYGERTWHDYARHKFAVFTREQAAAIVAYLMLKREADAAERQTIDEALRNYWHDRLAR